MKKENLASKRVPLCVPPYPSLLPPKVITILNCTLIFSFSFFSVLCDLSVHLLADSSLTNFWIPIQLIISFLVKILTSSLNNLSCPKDVVKTIFFISTFRRFIICLSQSGFDTQKLIFLLLLFRETGFLLPLRIRNFASVSFWKVYCCPTALQSQIYHKYAPVPTCAWVFGALFSMLVSLKRGPLSHCGCMMRLDIR